MSTYTTSTFLLPGRAYGSMDFKIWVFDDRGDIQLGPDAQRFLGKSYPFHDLQLSPAALDIQELSNKILEGVPPGNEAIFRGFIDKALDTFKDVELMIKRISMDRVQGAVAVVWTQKGVKEGSKEAGTPVPGYDGLRYEILRCNLAIPVFQKSASPMAANKDNMAIWSVANYSFEEELAVPFLRGILDVPDIGSLLRQGRPRVVGFCFQCGEPAPYFRSANWTTYQENADNIFEIFNICVVKCNKATCETAYLRFRQELFDALTPILTGSKAPPLSLACAYCHVLKSKKDLKRCSRCKLTWYCSTTCQRSDWKFHKESCRSMTEDDQVFSLETIHKYRQSS